MSLIGKKSYGAVGCVLLAVFSSLAAAQTVSQQRESLLNSARSAFNDGNHAFAIEKFREFLKLTPAPSPLELASAQYGLGLALLEGPKDRANAVAALTAAVANPAFPERPYALYYLGLALREQGTDALNQSAGKPAADAAGLVASANERFAQGAAQFALAGDAFAAIKADAASQPTLLAWVARSRCDQAELLIRLKQYGKAIAAVEPIATAAPYKDSAYRPLALYYTGYAYFGLKDYVKAGHSLSQLAPFDQGDFGGHVRYLLARSHHLSGERPEALAQYDALVTTYTKQKAAAAEALKNPALKPEDKARFQAIAASSPDYIARAMYYWGMLLSETGQPYEALPKLVACLQQFPNSSVAADAQFQLGICQYQTKQWAAALKTLAAIQDHPRLSDQVLRWLARAQVASTDPALFPPDPSGRVISAAEIAAHAKSIITGVDILKKACAKAAAATDLDAKSRHAVLLIELGDMQRRAAQYKDAVATYAQAIQSATSASLAEQAMARHAIALQLAGQYGESDDACLRFQQKYSQSTLVPEIALRYAENAVLAAYAAGPDKAKQLYPAAIQRLEKVAAAYPDTPYATLAKFGVATAQYQMGQFAQAAALLAKIPSADRLGGLAAISYLQADCLIRTLPDKADDALTLAKTIEALNKSSEMFDAYAIAHRNTPECIDATIKDAYCRQLVAPYITEPAEHTQKLSMARRILLETYSQFPDNPLAPLMVLESARISAKLERGAAAVSYLNRFQAAPLNQAPIAPLALIYLGDTLRTIGRTQEALTILTSVRTRYEAAMLKDPNRADWVPILQYALALALKETNQFQPARDLFKSIAANFPKRPEAGESLWRIGQCDKQEAIRDLDAARQKLAAANTPELRTAATASLEQAVSRLRQTAQTLCSQAQALAQQQADSPTPLLMYYDAAWGWRKVAEFEIEWTRRKMQEQALLAFRERIAKEGNPQNLPAPHPVEVRLSDIPLQPAEKEARKAYQAILQLNDSAEISNDARLELAEVLLARDEHAPAIELLSQMLQAEIPAELADRIRLRMGAACLAKGDVKTASESFAAIMQNPASPYAAYAREGLAEVKFIQKDYAAAVQTLAPFIEGNPPRVVANARDRAILRLGQSYAALNQWANCRAVLEVFVARFPASPLLAEARSLLGNAYQNLKQLDAAVAVYTAVPKTSGAEVAAQSLYQAGLCLLELKRPQEAIDLFFTVAYTYDYPDWNAAALCEAGRAMLEMKRPADATKLLTRVVHDNPTGRWAELARKLLAEIK